MTTEIESVGDIWNFYCQRYNV